MAEFATIARPYAKALFGLAQEKNQIKSWLGGLGRLAAVVREEKVLSFIEQPEINTSEKAKVLADLAGLQDGSLKNFVAVLAEQKRLLVLPEVYAQYQDLALALNDTKPAVIYSAYELSPAQLVDLTARLKRYFHSELEVAAKVDPSLIGGVKVEVGDQVLDLSIQGKLNALYSAMMN